MSIARLAIAAALSLLLATQAQAAQGEHVLSLRPEYTYTTTHGAGFTLGYQWGIDDWWNLWAETGWSILPDELSAQDSPALHRVYGGVGTVFNIDAFEWVPYLLLSIGGYGAIPAEGQALGAFGLSGGGGVDYRPARSWGVGIFVQYHVMLAGQAAPNHLSAGARFNFYF